MSNETPSASDHLPDSIQCKRCTHSTVFLLSRGQVKTHCDRLHLIVYDSHQPRQQIVSCSRFQQQG